MSNESLPPYNPDESSVGIWFWLILFILVNALWIGADLWLRFHNHEYLTTEYREGLKSEVIGPFLAAGTVFVVVAFFWHMFVSKGSN